MHGDILLCVEDAFRPTHLEARRDELEGSWAWGLSDHLDQRGGRCVFRDSLQLLVFLEILLHSALARGDPSFQDRRTVRFSDRGAARLALLRGERWKIDLWQWDLGRRSCGCCFLLFLDFALRQWSNGIYLLMLLGRLIASGRQEQMLEVGDAAGYPSLHRLRISMRWKDSGIPLCSGISNSTRWACRCQTH